MSQYLIVSDNFMKITAILISLCTFFSCNNRQSDNQAIGKVDLQSKQDIINQKVKQTIFGEDSEFQYTDFHDLKSSKYYDRVFAGNLKLTTGRVVCTDPIYRELGLPQSWTVSPGNYPVYLYVGLEDDIAGEIAYAEVIFKDEVPLYWEFSLIPETMLTNSFEKKMNGMFPVENGLGSFSDYETWKKYDQEINDFYNSNKNGNYYTDILEKQFKGTIGESSREKDWVDYKPKHANGNIIMFSSGGIDGLYPRYVGYDKNGYVIKLIADFIQVTYSYDLK